MEGSDHGSGERDGPVPDGTISSEAVRLREMSRVAAALYLSAAAFVAGSLLLSRGAHDDPGTCAALAAASFSAGILWWVVGERILVPQWAHVGSAVTGSVLIAALVVAAGPAFAGVYGVLLLYVAAFTFYYLPGSVSLAQVGFGALAYGWALWQVDAVGWQAKWLVVAGTTIVGGGMIGSAGRRAAELLRRERAATARLGELDRLKDEFMQMLAHDLRSPLSAMVGLAETIATRLDQLDDDTVRELAQRQARRGRHLVELVGDLLDTERLRSQALRPRLRKVRLDELVSRCVELALPDSRPRRLHLEPIELDVDPLFIERVVENLVSNARQHTPDGTPITIALTDETDGAQLRVEDHGPGVPDELKQTIFERFRQGTSTEGGGSGLGLALVRALTEAHGGRCWVEDRPGGGASFRVWLPSRSQEPPE